MSATVFDLLLALGLLWLGWQLLATRNPFRAVTGFIAFGFLMALVWARLDAPDIALAEAAIGGGLMGALLLSAAGRHAWERDSASAAAARLPAALSGVLAAAAGVAVIWALVGLDPHGAGLREEALAALPGSGARNPVTAVLLNFRGYDTFLEVAVLLLAVASVWSLGLAPDPAAPRPGPLLLGMLRVQLPLLVLFGGYLLWAGAESPGGAFQAGVVLGSAGILASLAGLPPPHAVSRGTRCALGVGFAVFWCLAAGLLALGYRLLELPPRWAAPLLLLTEGALGLSVAATMMALFVGVEPRGSASAEAAAQERPP